MNKKLRPDLLMPHSQAAQKKVLSNFPRKALDKLKKIPAREAIDKIKCDWPLVIDEMCLELANQYMALRKFPDAILILKEIIDKISSDYKPFINLAISLYQVGEYRESVLYSRKAYELKPQDLLVAKIYLDCLLLSGSALEID